MASRITVDNLSPISHNSVPVITTELLAQLYGTEAIRIQQNYLRNAERFIECKHFYKLQTTELKELKHRLSLSESVKIAPNVRSLILWTERGAARHAKMLETDQAWEVFEQLEDCYFNTERSNRPPQYKTEAAELFTNKDINSLTHLVWSMASGFRFQRAWSQAVWHSLRRATGVPSPQRFEIRQIPLLAEECHRIYRITNQLKDAIFNAEQQTLRRLLRHREDEAIVLGEMQRMLEESTQEHYGVMTHALEKWQQANVNQFLQRDYSISSQISSRGYINM